MLCQLDEFERRRDPMARERTGRCITTNPAGVRACEPVNVRVDPSDPRTSGPDLARGRFV